MKQTKKEVKVKRPRVAKTEKVASVNSTLSYEEVYERNKTKLARKDGKVGVICGYTKKSLIMAVTVGFGWLSTKEDATILIYLNNKKGYTFCNESNIL
jgi:hypothetical protein